MGELVIAATGHRPDKLGGYGSAHLHAMLVQLAGNYFDELRLREALPQRAISGMALGWDQAFAEAAVRRGIPLVAAIPHDGQWTRWHRREDLARYRNLLACASQVVEVSPGPFRPWKPHRRNEWMVDNCTRLCALFNGVEQGGTFGCVSYARRRERPIDNRWEQWTASAP